MVSCKCHNKWTVYHLNAFVLTFTSYAFFHATRKTFSNVKHNILEEWTPQYHNETIPLVHPNNIWNRHHMFLSEEKGETFLGILDTSFLIAYAVGLFISGILGDIFNLRYVLTIGMCLSGVIVVAFGSVTEWLGFYNVYLYVFLWALNGLVQSLGWPAVVAVMGNWFGKSSRGWVMGAWTACASVGNIIGALVAGAVVDYGYEYTFLATGTMLFGFGACIFLGLVPSPREVGLPELSEEDERPTRDTGDPAGPEEDASSFDIHPLIQDGEVSEEEAEATVKAPAPLGLVKAVLLPGVIPFSLSYACLKLVNYAFFFWLPFYLTNKFKWDQSVADDISIWYDVGGIVGGFIAGWVSDLMGRRSIVVQIMLLCSFPALYGYSVSPDSKKWNAILMAVAGVFVGGPANIISSAITVDLGRQEAVAGNSAALATVTGIIDGTGSVGAAIGQFLVPVIQLHLNWHWVFYFFLLMNFLTMLCIMPIFIREVKSMRRNNELTHVGGYPERPLLTETDESFYH